MPLRYFMPRFQIASMEPAQDRLRSKIGGLPWGLPERFWPVCCGTPQKLLAQICHEAPMVDLGEEEAVLHLFQCLECGGLHDEGRGAFILKRRELVAGLTRMEGWDRKPEYGEKLIGEAWIEGWEEKDDGIPAERMVEFFDERKLWALHEEFPGIEWFAGEEATRFGGSPRWTGWGPTRFPEPPYEFLFQLNNDLYIDGKPPHADEIGCPVWQYDEGQTNEYSPERSTKEPPLNAPWFIQHERSSRHYSFEFTNLGSDGRAFVFIDRKQQPCAVKWFWNR